MDRDRFGGMMAGQPKAGVGPPQVLDGAQVAARWGVDPASGLTTEQARERLSRWGPNELGSTPTVPVWRRIIAQFKDPLVYLLLVAVAISGAVWWGEGAHGVPVDVLVITAVLVLNAVIGLVQELRAADAVAALARLTRAASTVLRDGSLTTVPSTQVVPGDILVLGEGDAVGADARLLTATGLKIQEASLTGESEAVVKDPATLAGEVALADRTDMVFKGTAVVEGVGRAVVTGTGMDTEMGAVARLLESAETEPSPLQVELGRVSRTLGLAVVAVAVVVMAAVYAATGADSPAEWRTVLLTGVSLAVAAVPEGLVAILSLVLAIGARRMAQRKAVVKDLRSVETLGSATVICSDKTGTLTRNEMTLREIVTASGRVEVSGTGYAPEGSCSVRSGAPGGYAAPADPQAALAEARVVLTGGVLANNARLTHGGREWTIAGDPTEAAFLVAQHKLDGVVASAAAYQRRAELPFTSDRKMMSVLARHGARVQDRVFTKGAPDVLLERCTSVRVGQQTVPLGETGRHAFLHAVDELSEQGYRTLAVAYRVLGSGESPDGSPIPEGRPAPGSGTQDELERQLTLAGVVGLLDPSREEVREAIALARRAGVRPIMITGDHPVTARRIGTDLGLTAADGRAVTGVELDALDDPAFAAAVGRADVFARVSPRTSCGSSTSCRLRGTPSR